MKDMWNIYVAGEGAFDEKLVTNFVTQLRDAGLTINEVRVLDGHLHDDLMAAAPSGDGENGWTLYVYGEGTPAVVYNNLPTFLASFRDAGINLVSSGIVQGTLRDIPITA